MISDTASNNWTSKNQDSPTISYQVLTHLKSIGIRHLCSKRLLKNNKTSKLNWCQITNIKDPESLQTIFLQNKRMACSIVWRSQVAISKRLEANQGKCLNHMKMLQIISITKRLDKLPDNLRKSTLNIQNLCQPLYLPKRLLFQDLARMNTKDCWQRDSRLRLFKKAS